MSAEATKCQVLEAIGSWGPWQRKYICILGAVTLLSAVPTLITRFMAADTEFWCEMPPGELSSPLWAALEEWKNSSSPVKLNADNEWEFDACKIWNSTDFVRPEDNSTVACTSWTYDRTTFSRTIVQQFDLVCDKAEYKNYAQSVFFAGLLLGVFCMGYSADRFGRKPTIITATLVMVAIGTILPFMPNIEGFLVLRFIHGFTKMGVFTIIFIWSVEQVGDDYKTYIGIGLEFPWVAAWLMLALLGYLIPDWQYLSWITSIPGFVCIGLFWIIPESPKWQLSVGKLDKAEMTIRQAAEMNGRVLPETWKLQPVIEDQDKEAKKGNLFDLFKHKNLAIKTLILYFNWFTNSFVYYGLTLNTGKIAGSVHLNFFLNGLMEIPAYIICMIVLKTVGRKLPYCVMLGIGGLALLCTIAIPKDYFYNNWPIVVLAMIGKLCITGTFAVMYVWSSEIYPTVVRSVGVGSSSVWARLGGIVAPYVGDLGAIVGSTFPIAVYGITSLVAASLALLLPETKTRKMPDTIEEGENVKISFKDGIFA